MLSPQDYKALAVHLIERHGAVALTYADRAVNELEAQGEDGRAGAWRLLKDYMSEILIGRIPATGRLTLH